MVACMAKKDIRRTRVKATDYSEQVDAFSRIDGEIMRKFDELAEAAHRSRSSQIAFLVEQFVDAEYAKFQTKRQQNQPH